MSIRPTSEHPRVVSQGYLGNANPIQKSTLTFAQNVKCFPKGYVSSWKHQQPLKDAFLVNGPIGGQADAIGPQGEVV